MVLVLVLVESFGGGFSGFVRVCDLNSDESLDFKGGCEVDDDDDVAPEKKRQEVGVRMRPIFMLLLCCFLETFGTELVSV